MAKRVHSENLGYKLGTQLLRCITWILFFITIALNKNLRKMSIWYAVIINLNYTCSGCCECLGKLKNKHHLHDYFAFIVIFMFVNIITFIHPFNHWFIHAEHLYSASPKYLLKGTLSRYHEDTLNFWSFVSTIVYSPLENLQNKI